MFHGYFFHWIFLHGRPISRVGPESVLSRSIKDKLIKWLLGTSRTGFPINKTVLIHSVIQLVEAEGLSNSSNNVPKRIWFEGFLKCHSPVGQERVEHLCQTRATVTENVIRSWFWAEDDLCMM